MRNQPPRAAPACRETSTGQGVVFLLTGDESLTFLPSDSRLAPVLTAPLALTSSNIKPSHNHWSYRRATKALTPALPSRSNSRPYRVSLTGPPGRRLPGGGCVGYRRSVCVSVLC